MQINLASKGNQAGQQSSISTSGVQAIGVAAQSIGGYGGSAVKQAGQGASGNAAQINADVNTQIVTTGADAMGMLSQSIGGGGGQGAVASDILGSNSSSNPTLSLGWGGSVGNGGNGGIINMNAANSSVAVSTAGYDAHGVVCNPLQAVAGSIPQAIMRME
ncbi:hypothetical protein [Castellaniella sp.]|uniref:hypothetical protein n=1 Tax=Castellaniella sp. TaxID=1955812 RepID=UPI002AFF3B98|nr:hypothetical protein [Castellaniella sp.]